MKKHLSQLLRQIDYTTIFQHDPVITQLSLDSRAIDNGTLFCAYPGTQKDGRDFMLTAKEKGAAAIIYEAENFSQSAMLSQCERDIPCIAILHLAEKISQIAADFYDNPGQALWIVGVTGTSGKTSCTYFIAQALEHLHLRTAIIGTTGKGRLNALQATSHTTPNPIEVQHDLYQLKQNDIQCIAMEASSHALDQHRVSAVPFQVAVFTNLSHEHLDYHHTMENYAQAKAKLFAWPTLTHAIVNIDDLYAEKMLANVKPDVIKIGFTLTGKHHPACDAMLAGENFMPTAQGFSAQIRWQGKLYDINCNLLGEFNFANVLATVGVLLAKGVEIRTAIATLATFSPVPGRMQCLGGKGDKPLVVVDYAHKPAALEQVLKTLKAHCAGKLWCVFGCGGERDRTKRPLMAQLAEQYADKVIVTDDNPRHEDPIFIVQEIMAGFNQPQQVMIEHDRFKAIHHAIQHAGAQDIILIAGKGHETYQQVGDEKHPFDDATVANQLL